jgi:HEAT repeat protein
MGPAIPPLIERLTSENKGVASSTIFALEKLADNSE